MTNDLWFLPKKSSTKRILFHTINHIGLGHLNRSISIAQWLKAKIPDLQVLFLIEGGEDLIEPTGFPWILVPDHKSENEQRDEIIKAVLNVFRPDLAMHDVVVREPIFAAIKNVKVKQVLVGRIGKLLRDQLRSNLPMINEMDLIIVPHQREEVQPSDQALLAQYTGKILYAGPVVREKNQTSYHNLQQKLGLANEHKVILATFGGGGWHAANVLLANLLAAKADILKRCPQAKLIVIAGPHFSGDLPRIDDFVCYASRFEPFLTDYLNIASAVVCLAGYNTVNEIAASGLPAICVPAHDAMDQVDVGGTGEYAQSFPNIVLGNTDIQELTRQVTDALVKERDFSVIQKFRQRAEVSSRSIVDELKKLLGDTNHIVAGERVGQMTGTSISMDKNGKIQPVIAVLGATGHIEGHHSEVQELLVTNFAPQRPTPLS